MKDRRISHIIGFILCFFLAGCGEKEGKELVAPDTVASCDNEDMTIGVTDGYIFEEAVTGAFPRAQVRVFESRGNAYKALMTGEINALADDEPILRARMRGTEAMVLLEGYVEPSDYGFVFPKNEEGDKLCGQFSAYVEGLEKRGELQELDDKWFGERTDNKKSDTAWSLKDTNGRITMAFEPSNIPFAYMSGGRPVGYDIDLAIGFCRMYGYALDLVQMDFAKMLQGVEQGVYDMGGGAITITPQRQKVLNFSKADYSGGISIAINAQAKRIGEDTGWRLFADKILHAFQVELREMKLLKGLGVGLLMALTAFLAGSILGTWLYLLVQRSHILLRSILYALTKVSRLLPVLVLPALLLYGSRYYMSCATGLGPAIALGIYMAGKVYLILLAQGEAPGGREVAKAYRVEEIDAGEYLRNIWRERGEVIRAGYGRAAMILTKTAVAAGCILVEDILRMFDDIGNGRCEVVLPVLVIILLAFLIIDLLGMLLRKILVSRKEPGDEPGEVISSGGK